MMTFTPHPYRSPNTFLHHELKRFDDGKGHKATLRIAVYKDKKGIVHKDTVQVMWDKS